MVLVTVMILGGPSSLRPWRVVLVTCLTVLTLCAPLMIVCEGGGHEAIEWIFSNCCGSPDDAIVSPAAVPGGASYERTGAPDGRCADSCVDTALLASAPEPSRPTSTQVPLTIARPGVDSLTPHLPGFDGSSTLLSPPPLHPPAFELSTVLLI
jgi:hypothetical protein